MINNLILKSHEDGDEINDADNDCNDKEFDPMFHEDGEKSDDIDCDRNYEEFDPEKFFGVGGGFNDIGCDSDEEGFDPEMFHGDGDGFDGIGCDYYNNDYEKSDSMRFHVFSKNHQKLHSYCFMQGNTDGLLIVSVILDTRCQKNLAFFCKGSNYDYDFIIKQLVEEFEGQFECLGENTEKYATFSIAVEKQENRKTLQYKIRFIDSIRFMASSCLSLADNLTEGLHQGNCQDCKLNI